LKRTALVLFGKVPLPGRVKTRLARSIGPGAAAVLAEAFLRDAARSCAALAADAGGGGVSLVLAGDPAPHPFWSETFPAPWRIEPQGQGDLGRRLAATFEREFGQFEKVAVLGSDHPALRRADLDRFLSFSDAIWPARDGGYAALLLSRRPSVRELFEGLAWSTGNVCEGTVERARRASIDLRVFPETYDVDREEDLESLAEDLACRDPNDPEFPSETWAALRRRVPLRGHARGNP